MRPWIVGAAGLLLVGLGLVAGCGKKPPDGVALVGATLIDGTGGPPLANAAIVVRKGKIEWLGTRTGFQLPARTTQIDLKGRWIMPGLIDAHAHASLWAMKRYLAWGVTSVRDLHGSLDTVLGLRRTVNSGRVLGPRIYSAGAMIDGTPPTYPSALAVTGPKDARKAVDRLVNAGVDLIKVYTRIDPPLLDAVLDEARTFNLRVTGHLGLSDAMTAARSGISSIEHLSGVPESASRDPAPLFAAHQRGFLAGWTAFERSWSGLDSAGLSRVAQELARRNVTLVPTLVLHQTFSRLDSPALLEDRAFQAVPPGERQRWNVADIIARAGWKAGDFDAFRRSRPVQDLFLREFGASGGRIAAGTDASNQLLVPGYSEHQELQLLVAAGFSPRDAILAATRNGALLLGVDSLGLLAPGKVADLVILTRDPLADIRNTLAIDRVMSRGHLLSPDSLRATW